MTVRESLRRSLTAGLLSGLLLAGCATQPLAPSAFRQLPARVELSDTPFFPQDRHQCGPASLATALVAAGHPASPERLSPQLYLPQQEGSLQAEMLAAARRQGALALRAPDTLNGLLSEVAAGRPVIVLQNLGLSWVPRWHYAVVIGHDSRRGEILLRSGITRREILPVRTFERTWARSGNWAMMVLPAGELPEFVERRTLENALASLEKYASNEAMLAHYVAGQRRWPTSLLLGIGLGNAQASIGRAAEAEQSLRRTLKAHPNHPVVLNNLATVLQMQHKLDEALAHAQQAIAAGDEWQAQARATRAEIIKAIADSTASAEGHQRPAR